MKKVFLVLITLVFISIIFLLTLLTTIGIETNKFNKIISDKINKNNQVKLELETIKFKFDINQISLFLETNNPKIFYREVIIPAKNIKVYIDFLSIIKSDTKIEKVIFNLKQININQIKKLSKSFKPSNFTSFINNNIKEGKLNTEIEIYLNKENSLNNFIARGSVTDVKSEIFKDLKLEDTKFSFFADKTDILIQNFFSQTQEIKIEDGDMKINLSPEIAIETNFKTIFNFNNGLKKYSTFIPDINFINNITNVNGEQNNNLNLSFDKTYKLKNYSYRSNGKIFNAKLNFKTPMDNNLLKEQFKDISFSNTEVRTSFSSKKNSFDISGKYTLNKSKPQKFEIENIFKNKISNVKVNFDYDNIVELDFINYKKEKGDTSNIFLEFKKRKNSIEIDKLNIQEGKNLIQLNGIKLENKKFVKLEKILVKTYENGKKNNDFIISYGKTIKINGELFDAKNLPKIISISGNNKFFSSLNKEIEIELKTINAPLSEKLKNFRLIGTIKKGKFIKVSSKGDFGENNFLDISLKNNDKNKKKYLEIYSDLTKPLLTEYSFFNGLSGGKLIYTSIFDDESSNSKLKIENFKVINAPGLVKLLSLADLGGLSDLAAGEGISFDVLEINMEKSKDTLKLNEILALGPSISVLMEGYQNPSITSIRGTLVPAKTLNKMISRIPVLGDIIIPKEIGEGLFGISFKMKGPPNQIKTTINPIRTITPRFIQKIVDKNKKTK